VNDAELYDEMIQPLDEAMTKIPATICTEPVQDTNSSLSNFSVQQPVI